MAEWQEGSWYQWNQPWQQNDGWEDHHWNGSQWWHGGWDDSQWQSSWTWRDQEWNRQQDGWQDDAWYGQQDSSVVQQQHQRQWDWADPAGSWDDNAGDGRRMSQEYPSTGEACSASNQNVGSTLDEMPSENFDERPSASGDRSEKNEAERKPRTGKEHVPAYDGSSESMREYTRRVKIYVATTGTDPEFRAGRLLEQLSGQAWKATETLRIEDLRCDTGVDKLLSHLWQELEPLEHLRVFSTLQAFYRSFRRHKGEEFPAFDTRFRVQLQCLEEIGAPISGITKSFWFLETAALSNDLRKQVVAAAGGTYDYDRLRSAIMAIIPQVQKDEELSVFRGDRQHQAFRRRDVRGGPHKVNMVGDEEKEHMGDGGDPDDPPEGAGQDDGDDADETASQLEREAEVMLTQAAKRRAQADKARGYQKVETTSQREERIKQMKAKMPCSACKAHGHTRYGHWHSDKECPYHDESATRKKPEDGKARGVFTVTNLLEDEEMSEDDDDVYEVMLSGHPARHDGLAMCDTCCAKTVAGESWMARHMKLLWENGVDFFVVEESEAFRFGPGNRIHSSYAVLIPLGIQGGQHQAVLRVSVVPRKVPMLMSKSALESLGSVLFIKQGRIELQELGTSIQLVSTKSGHVGFNILDFDLVNFQNIDEVKWLEMAESNAELMVVPSQTRTGFDRVAFVGETSREPLNDNSVPRDKGKILQQPCGSTDFVKDLESLGEGRKDVDHSHAEDQEGDDCMHRRNVRCEGDRVGHPRHEPLEGDLQSPASSEAEAHPESRLEESQSRHLEGDILGDGGAGLGEERHGSALVRLAQGSVHPGDRVVGNGLQGGSRQQSPRGGASVGTRVPSVQDSNGEEDKSTHSRRFLGLSSFPSLQGVFTSKFWRATHGCDAENPCREGDRKREVQGQRLPRSSAAKGKDKFCGTFGEHRLMECTGCRSRGPEGHEESQHESHNGRGGGDHEETPRDRNEAQVTCQGIRGVSQRQLNGPSDAEDDLRETPKPSRSPDETRRLIQEGNARRKAMRKGVARRLLGATKRILHTAFVTSAVFALCLSGKIHEKIVGPPQPDVLEVFGGSAEVSMQFSKWGWRTMEPCDVIYGCDLHEEHNRIRILDHIRHLKPRLVVVSYPCTLWGPLTRISYASPQERRRLLKLRQSELPFLELTENIFDIQLREGRDALGENPLTSESFKTKPIQNILNHPDVYAGVGHGCRFGVRHCDSGKLLKKPTLWFSTAVEICDELSLRCRCVEPHGQCMGGKRITQHAGRYTKEIAQAIHRGYVRVLKRKDPGRIREVLRYISTRLLRRKGYVSELRWSKKHVEKKLNQWSSCLAVENPVPEEQDVGMGDAPDQPPIVLNEDGISFEVPRGRRLDDETKRALRKLHINLGHPSGRDFERYLRLGGAKQELVEASSWLKCMTCQHAKRPRLHRSVNPPPSNMVFGDEICVDCIQVHDAGQVGHWFLSILDRATSFHLLGYLPDHSPESLRRALDETWCSWAGVPCRVSIDLEGGFASEDFWNRVGEWGTPIIPIAGTAHWQAGKIERHNQTVKHMLETVIRHGNVNTIADCQKAARETCQAKNELVREHGWSPNILVFGREPRAFGEIHRLGNPEMYHPSAGVAGTDVAKHVRYRYKARVAYVKYQVKTMLNRTVEQRTRKFFQPQIGQMVFVWREARLRRKQNPSSNWIGPGYIVGVQGTNAWVSCGGRCYVVASEHLRLAQGDEESYGIPEAQQALALFRKMGRDATYDDLVGQNGPPDESLNVPPEELVDELIGSDMEVDTDLVGNQLVPQEVRILSRSQGWTKDRFGNLVFVDRHAVKFVIPKPLEDGSVPRFRTTWAFMNDREWKCLERDVDWSELETPNKTLPETPLAVVVTLFGHKRRKETAREALNDRAEKRIKTEEHDIFEVSKQKEKRMIDKEIPFDKIPPKDKTLFDEAILKEWNSWLEYDTVEQLSEEESRKVIQEKPDRILKSRMVLRNKNAGAFKGGFPLPVKAKARLCVLGQYAPGVVEGDVAVDSPTVQRISMFYFLNCIVSWGWLNTWRIGDVSCAFLQGEMPEGKELYMKPPPTGLPNISPNVVFRLKKAVYGLPEAPKAWFDSLCKILIHELGFQNSLLDQAFFRLYNPEGQVCAMLITHVDDIMTATDGSKFAEEQIEKLRKRLPFGQWKIVEKEEDGIEYCGKEMRIKEENGESFVDVSQNGFINGRLEEIEISPARKTHKTDRATKTEETDFRSTVGSLQWLSTQTRPDLSFEINQLQKRAGDLRVEDLLRANRTVREAKKNQFSIKIRKLGEKFELVIFHDAALYNSVGVELNEQEAGDMLFKSSDRKLVYSQKGVVLGFVPRGDTSKQGEKIRFNLIDWKSATNRRVIESSFAAETQAALLGQGLGKFAQSLHVETCFGKDVMLQCGETETQQMLPAYMITDCKSLYDCVKKQGQHVSDKSSIVSMVLLRQMCEVNSSHHCPQSKTQLLWVPTAQQLADGLTKCGKGQSVRDADWFIQLHGESLKKMSQSRRFGSV